MEQHCRIYSLNLHTAASRVVATYQIRSKQIVAIVMRDSIILEHYDQDFMLISSYDQVSEFNLLGDTQAIFIKSGTTLCIINFAKRTLKSRSIDDRPFSRLRIVTAQVIALTQPNNNEIQMVFFKDLAKLFALTLTLSNRFEVQSVRSRCEMVVYSKTIVDGEVVFNLVDYSHKNFKRYVFEKPKNAGFAVEYVKHLKTTQFLFILQTYSDHNIFMIFDTDHQTKQILSFGFLSISKVFDNSTTLFLFTKSQKNQLLLLHKQTKSIEHQSKWSDQYNTAYFMQEEHLASVHHKFMSKSVLVTEFQYRLQQKCIYIYMLLQLGITNANSLQAVVQSFHSL